MKIFDHKGLTSLTEASQDPVARGYSYIVKIENYSALKCCFQEVKIITHRTHSPKEVVGLLLPGSFSGKVFFKVMFLPTSRKKLPAVPRAPFSLPLSLFCPGENGDAPTAPQRAWNSCDPVWWHQSGQNILPNEPAMVQTLCPVVTPALTVQHFTDF